MVMVNRRKDFFKTLFMRRIYCCCKLLLIMLSGSALISCSEAPSGEHVLLGRTMGTYYSVTLAQVTPHKAEKAQKVVDEVLERVSRSMSVFDDQSEISGLNSLNSGQEICVSPDFARTMQVSFKAHALTRGAFDPSLGSLIDLWGFGIAENSHELPKKAEIEAALKKAGLNKIIMDENECLTRNHPDTKLNLSGVAKGYGVDAVATALKGIGIHSFLIDIGGEIYAGKARPGGRPWKIGIRASNSGMGENDLVRVLELEGQAVATSGNYHNFFIRDGRRYSHVIDPLTGYPADGRVAGATVVARSCALADALATAMLVLDVDESLSLSREPDVFEVIIQEVDDQGELIVHGSR
jgi:FAD:protein FMN transferase